MKLDLNNLLEEIYSWKSIVKKKDEEIETLQNQVKQSKQCIEILECSNSTLLQEVENFNNVVSTLHQSLSKIEEFEGEKKELIDEKMKIKKYFDDQEKLLRLEISELKGTMDKMKVDHKEHIEKRLQQTDAEVLSKLQSYSMTLRERENCILQLEDEIASLKNETSQKLLKMKIECEEKLSRMKNKVFKSKMPSHHQDFKSSDIFRQKFIEKEREAKEESLKLKKEIEDLQKEILSLKSANTFSKQNFTTANYLNFSENINCFEEANSVKRQKLNEDSSDDFVSINLTNKNVSKQADRIHHFKKKLFNPDMNYFDR